MTILVGYIIGDKLSLNQAQWIYTASLLIKDYLVFLLPFIIFFYLSSALVSFKSNAPLLLTILIASVVVSNALSVFISYGVGVMFLKAPLVALMPPITGSAIGGKEALEGLFSLSFLKWASADQALLAGLIAGFLGAYLRYEKLIAFLNHGRSGVERVLKKTFIPLLPLYILGFVIKLDREDAIPFLVNHYAYVFFLSIVLLTVYIALIYFIGSKIQKKPFLNTLKNMLPAGLTGFSTLSSAAALPITLKACEKNLDDKSMAGFLVPATANIHMMGDSLVIPLVVLCIMQLFGQPFPDLGTYTTFVMYYCLAKFSAAAVPGGGVIVLIPVFQTHLGLSTEAASLVTTLYLLQDPIFTAANVMGNGGFSMLLAGVLKPLQRDSFPSQT